MKTRKTKQLLKTNIALVTCSLVLASCGGGGGGGTDPATLAAIAASMAAANSSSAAPPTMPPSVQPLPPAIRSKCAMDTTVTPSYEEQRLPNKAAKGDALSFSEQLLKASGFDKFGPDFAKALCSDGLAGASSYDDTVALLHREGRKLWQVALDRVQGRALQSTYPTLPQSDDRPLYWARLTMTLALRQWKPDFPLTEDQRAALQNEFEKASRGQLSIDFPEGPKYKRILVSGFDPFTLGSAGKDGEWGLLKGNPSGATILSLDGQTLSLANGTTAVIHTFMLPVNYGPFIAGMQEDVLGPWFKPSTKRVDASVSMSQGRGRFDLENFNGRYQFTTVGNDNLNPPCADQHLPDSLECDINPPQRWLGYSSTPWKRDAPPQFTVATLPFLAMIGANTGAGLTNIDTGKTGGWEVAQHDTYEVFPACTKTASDATKAQDELNAATKANDTVYNAVYATHEATIEAAYNAWASSGFTDENKRAAYFATVDAVSKLVAADPAVVAAQAVVDKATAALAALPPISPLETNCAQSGGGGNYLSNASAYRNTLMRDIFGLNIPAGHIHTPIMALPVGVTDTNFNEDRNAIVAQASKLIFALAKSLAASPAP